MIISMEEEAPQCEWTYGKSIKVGRLEQQNRILREMGVDRLIQTELWQLFKT